MRRSHSKFPLNSTGPLAWKTNLRHFQSSLSPGAVQRPWGLDSLPGTTEDAAEIPAPPIAPTPRPRACSLVSGGCCYVPGWALGTPGSGYDSTFPNRALGDHATSWGAAVEGAQVPPLELRAPSSCLLTALLPSFIETACMFSFLIFLFHERQKKVLSLSSFWLGSKSAPGTKE